MPARDSSPKMNLAVSSTEFCQEIFDEREIGIRLRGGSGHISMIPVHEEFPSSFLL